MFILSFLYFIQNSKTATVEKGQVLFLISSAVLWLLLNGYTKLYTVPRTLSYTRHLENIIVHSSLFLFGIYILDKLSINLDFRINTFRLIIYFLIMIVVLKTITYSLLKYYRLLGKNYRNIMFLYEDESSELLKETLLQRKDYGYKIFSYSGRAEDIFALVEFWKAKGIDTMFIPSHKDMDNRLSIEVFEKAEENRVTINLIPEILRQDFFKYNISYYENFPVLVPVNYPLDIYSNKFIKRVLDILFSLFFLIFIGLWLFPVIAVLIKIFAKTPVLFTQKRYGYEGKIFECYKFCTMRNDNSLLPEERVTNLGKFLRKTSLDELPQFVNVLRGDMSIVGPRPHMLSVDDFYSRQIRRYKIRNMVRPGLTGLAQVRGLRGDFGDMNIRMKQRLLADIFYVKNWSLGMDFIIVLKTVFLFLKGDENAR
ncbi:putative colanic acid biosysnthesis UDP-glucose lipid carrier transferase [Riemerella columbipharyngis]|uniref:Putative colanic acid biosysnthesis UDP-glucose lipid carrier transferase n=1 Tax=Riemerella columbipharyngis TaxID=1071918 RepID=A0A1G7ADR2_9FLAO|nr:putative colanic acid biosysnthesis UDP-glucose lipid carrier transferase [Riemerella columbipharyngis]